MIMFLEAAFHAFHKYWSKCSWEACEPVCDLLCTTFLEPQLPSVTLCAPRRRRPRSAPSLYDLKTFNEGFFKVNRGEADHC